MNAFANQPINIDDTRVGNQPAFKHMTSDQEENFATQDSGNSLQIILQNDLLYRKWRAAKLQRIQLQPDPAVVVISDPDNLSGSERDQLCDLIWRNNHVIYQLASQTRNPEKDAKPSLRGLSRQLGLGSRVSNPEADDEHISHIEDRKASNGSEQSPARYIPYGPQALNWHTDGYYNGDTRKVRSFLLHCQRSAVTGGENRLIDHELLYILVRDQNPQWAHRLFDPHCFSIPANQIDDKEIRPSYSGPVFSIDQETDSLYLRYTERQRHISWKQDPAILDAISFIRTTLEADHPWIVSVRLKPGQGLLCNNSLHCRSAFDGATEPGSGRLLYRIRFAERLCQSN